MNFIKLIYFKLALLIAIPLNIFAMEFGYKELEFQHSKSLALAHEVNSAVGQFLHKNHLSHTDHSVLTQNDNLFLQAHTPLNTAVAVLKMHDVLRLGPISNQEANRAHHLFKVYDLQHNKGIWSVMFDYAKQGLLPVTRDQAALLLIAPYLRDMPRTNEPSSRPFLSPEQRQALSTVSLPEQLAECKTMLKDGTLIEAFKIEAAENSSSQTQNVESAHVIDSLNRILEKYHTCNTGEKSTYSKELTELLEQVWELRDMEGFALGTVVHAGSACKNIEEIKVNDLVAARDFSKDTQILSRVVNVYKEKIPTYFQIVLDTETINAAPDQKFYLPGKEQEVTAFELSASPDLQAAFSGSILEIKQIDEPIDVYKLEVEDNHNFHVSGKELLAHNYTPGPTLMYSTSNFGSQSYGSGNLRFRVECHERIPMRLSHQQRVYAPVRHHQHQTSQQIIHADQLKRKEVRKGFCSELNNVQKIATESRGLVALYQAHGLGNCARLEKRIELANLSKSQTYKWHFQRQNYAFSKNATEFLSTTKADAEIFKTCYGNPLQQHIHRDCVYIVERAAALQPGSVLYDQRSSMVELAESACGYNKAGETSKACHIVDLCDAFFVHAKAIAEGAAAGLVNVAEYAVDHPLETALCVVASEYVLAYQIGKVLVEVADISLDVLMKHEEGTKKWEEFIAPVNQVLDVLNGKIKVNSADACKVAACAAVSWKAQGKLHRGLGKIYSGAKAKALAYAKSNPLATPQQYLATADGRLSRFAYDSKKPENIRETILATGQKISKREVVLPKVRTYEQARNLGLEIIGDVNPHTGKPYIGKLGVGEGKIVGREWHDGDVVFRLDYDPVKGPHINVDDWRMGKGTKGTKIAIPFEGTKATVKALLKHLQ